MPAQLSRRASIFVILLPMLIGGLGLAIVYWISPDAEIFSAPDPPRHLTGEVVERYEKPAGMLGGKTPIFFGGGHYIKVRALDDATEGTFKVSKEVYDSCLEGYQVSFSAGDSGHSPRLLGPCKDPNE